MRNELQQWSEFLNQMLRDQGNLHGHPPSEYANEVFNTALGFDPDQTTIARLSNDAAEEALVKVQAMVLLAFAINEFGCERD